MNKELQEASKILLETVKESKDFVLEQMPAVVQQLILWKRAESVFWIGVGLSVIMVSAIVFILVYKKTWITNPGKCDVFLSVPGALGIASCATFPLSLLFTVCTVSSSLQVWLAPKLFILEYLSRLV